MPLLSISSVGISKLSCLSPSGACDMILLSHPLDVSSATVDGDLMSGVA
jgi:hypothetical protein